MRNNPDVHSWVLRISLMQCYEKDLIQRDTRLCLSQSAKNKPCLNGFLSMTLLGHFHKWLKELDERV